jgi:hypothetical protein
MLQGAAAVDVLQMLADAAPVPGSEVLTSLAALAQAGLPVRILPMAASPAGREGAALIGGRVLLTKYLFWC